MQEILMPSAIVQENEASYNARVVRNRARPGSYGDTAVFRNLDTQRNIVLGREALHSGVPVRITGPDKYNEGILDNMVLGALLKVLPDGHRNIMVSCGHTTNAVPYLDKMDAILNKKHHVQRHDGKEITYNIRGFAGWDEPAGGLIRHFHRNYVEDDMTPGKLVIVVDIGGRVSSMYPAEVLENDIQIYWNDGRPFPVGIQTIFEVLDQEFRSLYPDVFSTRNIPEGLFEEALKNVQVIGGENRYFTKVKGKAFDVTQAVLNATNPILMQIENVWVNNLNSGIDADSVVVTGGGGGRLFDMIRREAIHHDFIYRAEEPDQMHWANLRGGAYGTNVKVCQNLEQYILKSKTGNVEPVVLDIDPGNTNIKGQLFEVKDLRI